MLNSLNLLEDKPSIFLKAVALNLIHALISSNDATFVRGIYQLLQVRGDVDLKTSPDESQFRENASIPFYGDAPSFF